MAIRRRTFSRGLSFFLNAELVVWRDQESHPIFYESIHVSSY